jgi:serine/threonine kinase 16
MISDDGTPILMDFGSTVKARIPIENRSQALMQQVSLRHLVLCICQHLLLKQDIAAEQSTMAYRAPELFDVKTGIDLDEKVDIWVRQSSTINPSSVPDFCPQSLGCTLFALAYSHSPFENTQTTEQGGSIAMAVLNAQYKQPSSAYSQGLKDLVDAMLQVNPKDRPDIHKASVSTLTCYALLRRTT